MDREWNDSQPIYRQLRDRVVAMILDGVLKEGDPLPSVRNVAAEFRVNPLTVLKGYQQLVDERSSRPGEASVCSSMWARATGCSRRAAEIRRRRVAPVYATIHRLGLKAKELLDASRPPSDLASSKPDPSDEER